MDDNSNFAPNQDNASGTVSNEADNSSSVFDSGVFAGKTLAEAEKEFANLRQMSGRQSNELGDIRGQIAELRATQLQSAQQSSPQMSSDDIAELVQSNPMQFVNEMEKRITSKLSKHVSNTNKGNVAELQLLAKHPDKDSVIGSDEFKQWEYANNIGGFANVAVEQYRQSGDSSGVSFLLDSYKKSLNDSSQSNISVAKNASSMRSTGITHKETVKFTRDGIAKMSHEDRSKNHKAICEAYLSGDVQQ